MANCPGNLETTLERMTHALAEHANGYDRTGEWPADSLKAAGEAGAWRWSVPEEYGGQPLSPRALLGAYEALARGCMSTALIVTQRDGAVDLIRHASTDAPKQRFLPRLARGELHTTVGISQLTTSKRGKGPLMKAVPDGDGYRLTGLMPWVTGAEHADCIVTGGVLPDGRHLLACVPTDQPGVSVAPAFELMALTASRTSPVQCDEVYIEPGQVLRGPGDNVLGRRGPAKGLVASSCGLGLAASLIQTIQTIPPRFRSPFGDTLDPLIQQFRAVQARLHDAADQLDRPEIEYEAPAAEIRVAVNDVVVRLALAALTLGKGTGFASDHPVQRIAREALFMLVWSAPRPIQTGTLSRLLGDGRVT
jgi:alkylation response protein AidB-like acyl-CoA dehydrogenase